MQNNPKVSLPYLFAAIFAFFTSLINLSFTHAQNPVMINNGGSIKVSNGGVIVVNGGLENNGNWYADPGVISNDGDIYLRTNSGQGTYNMVNGSHTNGNGRFHIEQDWYNTNSIFYGDGGEVIFDHGTYGTNTEGDGLVQVIGGNQTTVFNNLTLAPYTPSKLVLVNVNSAVGPEGYLALSDRELATLKDTFFVYNNRVSAITRNNNTITGGFISSDINGTLVRSTNSIDHYIFPTGSSDGSLRYRPIDVFPQGNEDNKYAVRLRNNSADIDGKNTMASAASGINSNFNTNFYHSISRLEGSTPANISINYLNDQDGGYYSGIAFYDNAQKSWRDVGTVGAYNDGTFDSQTRTGWAFLKSEDKDFILYNEEGLIDTLPNIVTINGDGLNDVFHIRNSHLKDFSIKIFNRWGVLLFESNTAEIDWDGKTVAGVEVPEGTYFYVLSAVTQSDKSIKKNGFFMLIK